MKSSALVFLAAFVALSASWGGFVLAPQLQLGRGNQAPTVPTQIAYPAGRAGVARQGADVYRSLGCVYCHSQQVGQEKTVCEIILTDAGTNTAATLAMLQKVTGEKLDATVLQALPKAVMEVPRSTAGVPVLENLTKVGAKAEIVVSQRGADLSRGWGRRATVAQDLLYDDPVQPGIRRIGPDLANVALRQPDVKWHLNHLYEPKSVVAGSPMPAYKFLFEKRRIVGQPSPEALQLPTQFAPPAGKNGEQYEIVPTEAARALAEYLVSLRADVPLFEAPYTVPAEPAPATNAPAK